MKHIAAGVLTCPAEKRPTQCCSWVLTAPAAPPPLKWRSDIYPGFLSGSVHFFVFTLFFFVSLLISSLWPGHWWGIFQLCCCCSLFSAAVYRLVFSLNFSDQVRADTAHLHQEGHCPVRAAWPRCQQPVHESDWHFSDTPLSSDWLCWSRSGGFLQIKLGPLGGATDSWPVSDSTVRS